MKVVILCGGMGTRLREETEYRPKPMVNIGGRPILWHIMKIYAHYGYKDFVLCLGYKGEMIKQFFYNYDLLSNDVTIKLGNPEGTQIYRTQGNNEDWEVTLVDTGEKALKGARLKRVQKYIDGDEFMVTYGDGVANIDIESLISFHRNHGKLATLTGISPTSRFGELKITGEMVESFNEKPNNGSGLVNGGFFVFNRSIFNYLWDQDDCDLETGTLEQIAKEGQLMVYKHRGFWACMDTMRDRDYLNKLWAERKALWKIWD